QMPINRETYAFGSAYSSKSVSDEGDILYDDNEQERAEQTYGAAPLQLSMVKRVNKISGSNVLKFNGTVWEIPKNPMRSGFNRYTGFANTSEASSTREYLLNNIVDISSTDLHALALTKDGTIFSWGAGDKGQLGDGGEGYGSMDAVYVQSDNEADTPKKSIDYKDKTGNVTALNVLSNAIRVAAGDDHSMALVRTDDGRYVVYTWGDNIKGQLGNAGDALKSNLPHKVKFTAIDGTTGATIEDDYKKIMDIDAGYDTSAMLEYNGFMWTAGFNNYGQLGNLDEIDSPVPVLVGRGQLEVVPTAYELRVGEDKIAEPAYTATPAFNLIIDIDTLLGDPTYSSVDKRLFTVDDATKNTRQPKLHGKRAGKSKLKLDVGGLTAYFDVTVIGEGGIYSPIVAAGENHTVVLKSDGSVWTWGDNTYGQLGRTDVNAVNKVEFPIPDGATDPEPVKFVVAGKNSSYAVTESGRLYAWGDYTYGQLGSGTTAKNSVVPVEVLDPDGNPIKNVTQVSVQDNTALILVQEDNVHNGIVYGMGDLFAQNSGKIKEIPNLDNVMEISGIYALTRNGTVWQIVAEGTPYKVPLKYTTGAKKGYDLSIIDIAAGADHLLALDGDNTLWAYGSNAYGQLGQPVDTPISGAVEVSLSVPMLVYKDGEYVEVPKEYKALTLAASANSSYALAVYESGTDEDVEVLFGWGENSSNQISNRNTEPVTFPMIIESAPGNDDVPATVDFLTAGYKQAFVVDSEGRVWGIGENGHGQLANGDTNNSGKFIICGDSQIAIDKIDDSGNIIATGYGTIYIKEGEKAKLQASYDAFNVYKLSDDAKTKYDWTYTTNLQTQTGGFFDPILKVARTTDTDGISTDPLYYADAEGLAPGTTYVMAKESGSINKSSYARVVVIPADATYYDGHYFQPKVSAGTNHTMTVRHDGTIWGFGANDNGQLGTTDNVSSDRPQQAITLDTFFVDVAAGLDHSIALDSEGNVWTTGNNDKGQLGTSGSSRNYF
ncbi:MAG: hypothetical protein IJH36_09295, partial [Clostridia bacterium]|nr:hypothetical protein [Clostridia bacterium]